MMNGYILNQESKIMRILENVTEINEADGYILFGNNGKLDGVNFSMLPMVVTDEQNQLKVGDTLPQSVIDKRTDLIIKSDRELIEELKRENEQLMNKLAEKGVI